MEIAVQSANAGPEWVFDDPHAIAVVHPEFSTATVFALHPPPHTVASTAHGAAFDEKVSLRVIGANPAQAPTRDRAGGAASPILQRPALRTGAENPRGGSSPRSSRVDTDVLELRWQEPSAVVATSPIPEMCAGSAIPFHMVDVVKSSLRVVIDALRARRALLAEIALLRH
jgi:hypothetical protein